MAGLLLVGCIGDDGGFVSVDGALTGDQQDDIEQFLGTTLPASVVSEQTSAEFIAGMDDAVRLRVTMAEEDVAPFLQAVGSDEALRDGFHGVAPTGHPDTDWFQTGELTTFSGASSQSGDRAVHVTVDQADSATPTVYLFVFEL